MNCPVTNRVLTYDLALDLWKQDSPLNVVIASANNSKIYLELTELSLSLSFSPVNYFSINYFNASKILI